MIEIWHQLALTQISIRALTVVKQLRLVYNAGAMFALPVVSVLTYCSVDYVWNNLSEVVIRAPYQLTGRTFDP